MHNGDLQSFSTFSCLLFRQQQRLPKIFRVTQNTACTQVPNMQCFRGSKTGRTARPVAACSPASTKRRTYCSQSRLREQNRYKTEVLCGQSIMNDWRLAFRSGIGLGSGFAMQVAGRAEVDDAVALLIAVLLAVESQLAGGDEDRA